MTLTLIFDLEGRCFEKNSLDCAFTKCLVFNIDLVFFVSDLWTFLLKLFFRSDMLRKVRVSHISRTKRRDRSRSRILKERRRPPTFIAVDGAIDPINCHLWNYYSLSPSHLNSREFMTRATIWHIGELSQNNIFVVRNVNFRLVFSLGLYGFVKFHLSKYFMRHCIAAPVNRIFFDLVTLVGISL